MNDFREDSVECCLAQDYPNCEVYVLDDSTLEIERDRVDTFCRRHRSRVSIIRRPTRSGFKAGNLNGALRQIGDRYRYVCVVDADEIVPPKFLRELVAIAEANEHFGFVQASHTQYADTAYGKQTGHGIDLHWGYFLPARNRFGFVCFYGHGALLRYQALIAVGGFPEIVSEDIALSCKLREAGYTGYFAHDVRCYEEAPASYQAFRRRTERVTAGTLEFATKYLASFLRSAKVSAIEKADLLIASSLLYLPIAFVCFLVFLHSQMLLLPPGRTSGTIFSIAAVFQWQYIRTITTVCSSLRGWDFMAFLFLTVFAPLSYLVPNALRAPRKVILHILRMGAVHVSVCLYTLWVALSWLLKQRTSFIPTGDRTPRMPGQRGQLIEFFCGLGMLVIGSCMGSLCLMAVGWSLGLVPILSKHDMKGRITPVMATFPVLLTLIAVWGMPILGVGLIGMFAGLEIAHA